MEVALQPLTFILRGLDDPRARPAQLLEPGSKLNVQVCVLERHAESGGDRIEELGLLLEYRVVEKRCHASAVPFDEGQRPGLARRRQRDRLAIGIRVAPELRQPVGEPEGRISKSASKGLLQLRGAWVTSKLDEEVRDRRARKPGS